LYTLAVCFILLASSLSVLSCLPYSVHASLSFFTSIVGFSHVLLLCLRHICLTNPIFHKFAEPCIHIGLSKNFEEF